MGRMIYDFVQSLTMREKAYFKRFSRVYSDKDNSNYLRIFEALEKQTDFEPELLQKTFANDAFGQYLSSEQHYLLEQLLDSLINFHFESSHHRRILKLILYVDLLTERGFRKKAQKILRQAKTLAYQHEEFSLILKLIQTEEEILFSHGVLNFTQQLQLLRAEREEVTSKIQNFNDLRLYREQVRELQFTAGYIHQPEHYPNIYNNPLLENEEMALSIGARENWHYIQGLKHYLLRDFVRSQEANQQYLAFFELHEAFFKKSKKLPLLSNLMYQSALIKDKYWFEEAGRQLEQLKNEKDCDRHYIAYIQYARWFEWYYQCEDLLNTRRLMKEVDGFLQDHSRDLGSTEVDYLCRLMIRAAITTQQWSLAPQWVHWWYKTKKSNHGLRYIRLYTLIAYYELGYKQLLESEVLSTQKILRQHKQLGQLEQVLIAFFKNYIRFFESPEQLRQLLISLWEQLLEIKVNPIENQSFITFGFDKWVEDKLKTKGS